MPQEKRHKEKPIHLQTVNSRFSMSMDLTRNVTQNWIIRRFVLSIHLSMTKTCMCSITEKC